MFTQNTSFDNIRLGNLFILCLDAFGMLTIVTIVLHQTDHRSLPLQINHDMHDLNHRIKEVSSPVWHIDEIGFAKFLNLIYQKHSV